MAEESTQESTQGTAQDCLFCRIAAGDLEATVVAEGSQSLAFEDVDPQAPTHVLVIPRTHVADAAELAKEEPQTLVELVDMARRIAAERELAGYRLVFNTGGEAGQTVFHAHLHLLGGRSLTWPPG